MGSFDEYDNDDSSYINTVWANYAGQVFMIINDTDVLWYHGTIETMKYGNDFWGRNKELTYRRIA